MAQMGGVNDNFASFQNEEGLENGFWSMFSGYGRGINLRTRQEFSIALLIIRDPSLNGGFRDIAEGWKFIPCTAKAGKKESNKFPLLLNGKNIGGFCNFQEQTHRKIISSKSAFVEFD